MTPDDATTGPLLPHVPEDAIRAAYARAPGREFETGKMSSPESSAALAANTFGVFLDRPADLPPLPGVDGGTWPARRVGVEAVARLPWAGGRHPRLDAVVETPDLLIGVESKRYEPFRSKPAPDLSKAYWRPVWGDRMGAFEAMRDRLRADPGCFVHLDAAQLVKHAFGLRTEAQRRGGHQRPALLYLYAEPPEWPDGRPLDPAALARHAAEARCFGADVAGAEVAFGLCSCRDLFAAFGGSGLAAVRDHAAALAARFTV